MYGDVECKLKAMEGHREKDPQSYRTVLSSVNHEIYYGTVGQVNPQSTSVALIRLHRYCKVSSNYIIWYSRLSISA